MNLSASLVNLIKSNRLFFLLSFSVIAFSSCKEPVDMYRNPCVATQEEKDAQKIVDIKTIKKYFRENNIDTANMQVTASGLHYFLLTPPGTGNTIQAGERVSVHYLGKRINASTFDSSSKFDSSYDRAEAFAFVVGARQVIVGWDEMLTLMRVGEKVRVYIPSYLAYGRCGSGSISSNEILSFEIELLRKL